MIEYGAGGVANSHRIHERRRSPARQTISDERRSLGRLLGDGREARQDVHRRAGDHTGQPSRHLG